MYILQNFHKFNTVFIPTNYQRSNRTSIRVEIEFTTPMLRPNIQLKLRRIRQDIYLAEMQVIGNYSTDVHFTDLAQKPIKLELFQNHPNPFNPTTTIRFDLPEKARVDLSVYNLVGQQI